MNFFVISHSHFFNGKTNITLELYVKLLLLLMISLQVHARTADDNLTHELAIQRKAQVKSVKYDITLELQRGIDSFIGKTVIDLELTHLKHDLTIDLNVQSIDVVVVNGVTLKKFPSRKGSFDIPKSALSKKTNLEIKYKGSASSESRGLRRIKDAVDGEEYLFTDFEPYHAHWVYPCFDQPDLKAVFQVSIKAPQTWTTINNELPQSESIEGDFKLTKFKPTPPISPYLLFIGAGPFVEWKDDFEKIPLILHSRKSMAKFMDAENVFSTIKKGLKFFTTYFDYPYPYSKYGQIFVPDLAMNATENPGAVTFNEQYLSFGPISKIRTESRDNIILHEISHMWFGNLVTQEWWNDLWLKESFATYMASIAQTKALNSEFGDLDMLNAKAWGYWQDLMITTHPVEPNIPDIRSSKGIFDGITYAKGAAALKQLNFYVGDEAFQKGIQSYFKKYALKNANREQFIQSIAEASGKDLKSWTEKWIQSSGPNKMRFDFSCAKGVINKAIVFQEKNSSGVLSPHRTLFGFYKPGKNTLNLISSIDITYDGEEKYSEELNGKECPQFVLPNQNDEDYGIFSFDKISLNQVGLALSKLPDTLSRYQVWIILMQMVKDGELSPKQFMEFTKDALKFEKDENLLGFIFSKHLYVRDFRQIYLNFLTVSERAAIAPDLEKIMWQRVQTTTPGSSLQNLLFDIYTFFAQSKETINKLKEMSDGKNLPDGIKIDPERRWRIYKTIAAKGHPEAIKLIENEMNFDPSMLAKISGIGARAIFPDIKIKKEIFHKIFDPNSALNYNELIQAAQNFNNPDFPELSRQFVEEYFQSISNLKWESLDEFVMVGFILFPGGLCTKEVEDISARSLKRATNLSSLAKKAWLEAHGELSRCVKVRAKKW